MICPSCGKDTVTYCEICAVPHYVCEVSYVDNGLESGAKAIGCGEEWTTRQWDALHRPKDIASEVQDILGPPHNRAP